MTDLTTVAAVKRSLRITAATTTYDDDLADYVAAATSVIEDITGPLITASYTRTFDGGKVAILLPFPAQEITSVTENDASTDDFTANLSAGIIYGGTQYAPRPFCAGRQNIVIVFTAGPYADVDALPGNVTLATRELIRFWWQIGQQGSRPGFGDAPEAEPSSQPGYAVPRRVIELLAPHQRVTGFA